MDVLSELDTSALPPDWKNYPAPTVLRDLGDAWLESLSSMVLQVPSAIVPDELNYLINPAHPDFSSIEIGDPVPFEIDLRLFKVNVGCWKGTCLEIKISGLKRVRLFVYI